MTKYREVWKPGELLEYERRVAAESLEDPPAKIIEDVLLPARGFLRARTLETGQSIRFQLVDSAQVPDILLYDRGNLKNCSSMSNTMMAAGKWMVSKGDALYSKLGQKMVTITEDTVGENVHIGGFCNWSINEVRYGIEGTHSCRSNLVASMAEYNLAPLDIEEGVFAAFMNVPPRDDGTFEILPPKAQKGDHIDLRADMDIIVAVSNCPSEHNPCNAWNPTPIRVVIYESD